MIPPKFDSACPFTEGLAAVTLNGQCEYINKSGDVVLRPDFETSSDCSIVHGHFADGLSRWRIGDKYGYIDHQGNLKIEPRFTMTDEFSEGLAYVQIDGKYVFIDTTGKLVIKPKYQRVENFSGGLARFFTETGWGYIDKSGKSVWETKR